MVIHLPFSNKTVYNLSLHSCLDHASKPLLQPQVWLHYVKSCMFWLVRCFNNRMMELLYAMRTLSNVLDFPTLLQVAMLTSNLKFRTDHTLRYLNSSDAIKVFRTQNKVIKLIIKSRLLIHVDQISGDWKYFLLHFCTCFELFFSITKI